MEAMEKGPDAEIANNNNNNNNSSEIGNEIAVSDHRIRFKPSHPSQQERKLSKVVHDHEVDDNGEMWLKVPRTSNQFQGKGNLKQGKKRGGIHEVVSSIKVLGDGFMKMEKMKIDMVREIERRDP
ncbi:hypothetical protein QVD17_04677 [Tagetes erecta]|uniref:Uncharacterized protein n=1 Tax=Tagetes erecta TaxID=13708 RepID=A0AAD8LK06_TARER|nr:hypothetical protein QVD17_04677 [Tagetes erecta]